MNVCYKLGVHQLEITEVRKDTGTSQSQRMSINCQSDVSVKNKKIPQNCLQRKRDGNVESVDAIA